MFCQKCGKELGNEANYCDSCGTSLKGSGENQKAPMENKGEIVYVKESKSSKSGTGVLLCLFLGLIGLIIGICIYSDEYERATFVKGWGYTFLGLICFAFLYFVLVFAFI